MWQLARVAEVASMGLRKTMKEKSKISPPRNAVLVSNVGSLEIIRADVQDDGLMQVAGKTVFTGIPPVVLSTDPRALTTRKGVAFVLWLLLGARIHLRLHYMRFGEAVTRDCHSNAFITEEKRQIEKDKLGRDGENLKDVEILQAEAGAYIKSNVNRDYWRAARGRGVSDWLPWVACGVIAIAGFVALVVQNLIFIQGG